MIRTLFVVAMTISTVYGENVYAFDRNLTGVWKNNSTTWIVGHTNDNARFVTRDYSEEFGQQTYAFDGKVKSGGIIDSFVFEGVAEDEFYRVNDDFCGIKLSLSAEGYMVGELGGRVIHMTNCKIKIDMMCMSGKKNVDFIPCIGTWK